MTYTIYEVHLSKKPQLAGKTSEIKRKQARTKLRQFSVIHAFSQAVTEELWLLPRGLIAMASRIFPWEQ